MSEWISVKDRLPENDGIYLGKWIYVNSNNKLGKTWGMASPNPKVIMDITHWKELPKERISEQRSI